MKTYTAYRGRTTLLLTAALSILSLRVVAEESYSPDV